MSRIHITGASGTGTTTLGRALAAHLRVPHYDADDFFWEATDPPFAVRREPSARSALVATTVDAGGPWVWSGSIVRWELPAMEWFDLAVFLTIPAEVRLDRLAAREREAFGAERVAPGGDMHENYSAFMEWAQGYDTAGLWQRSRALHEQWLAELTCPVLHIDGDTTTEARVRMVMAQLSGA